MALAVACLGGVILLDLAGRYLVVSDEAVKSDAVVVLSGGGPERLQEAAALIEQRKAEWLILTETGETTASGTPVTAEQRILAVTAGVSPNLIKVTDKTVSSTLDEAHAVAELMTRHRLESCIVVTDPYHTRRTRIIFRQELDSLGLEVRVVSARGHWFKENTWFLSQAGWENALREYAKLAAYFLGVRGD